MIVDPQMKLRELRSPMLSKLTLCRLPRDQLVEEYTLSYNMNPNKI